MRLRSSAVWFVLLLAWSGAVQARQSEQNHLHDVIYGHKLGVALTLDVFKPAKPNGIGVLWMVSGGWISSHDYLSAQFAKPFTSRGQTVFEVVHGSQPRFTIGEIVQDIQRAVRYVRSHAAEFGVDPNRLGIAGASSGGHLALTAAALGADGIASAKDPVDHASSRLQSVACFFPPTDFLNYGADGVNALTIDKLKTFWPAFGITDATPLDERARVARTDSPIYEITAKMPPTLVIHGDADPLVPIQQSQLLMAKLQALNVEHRLDVRPKKGHGWVGIEADLPVLAEWFDRTLGTKR